MASRHIISGLVVRLSILVKAPELNITPILTSLELIRLRLYRQEALNIVDPFERYIALCEIAEEYLHIAVESLCSASSKVSEAKDAFMWGAWE